MEFLIVGGILLVAFAILIPIFRGGGTPHQHTDRPWPNDTARKTPPRSRPRSTPRKTTAPKTLEGPAYVIDGDSLRIQKTEIRVFGIDAPEMGHPFGKKAKWEMVALCKGHRIRAEITQTDDHGRSVAKCYLPDGRDLSAEMVKMGLALDWPKFSGGVYKDLEPEGVRKKLWLADARQKGRMHVWNAYEERKAAKQAAKENKAAAQ